MPHPLTEWLMEHFGDRLPGTGEVDQEDVVDELEDTPLSDGYSSIEGSEDERQ